MSETHFWSLVRVWREWPLRTLTAVDPSVLVWCHLNGGRGGGGPFGGTQRYCVRTEFRATSCQPGERGHRCFTSRFNPPSVLSFRYVTGEHGWMGFLLLSRPVWLWSATQTSHWCGPLNRLCAHVQIISECFFFFRLADSICPSFGHCIFLSQK